MTQPPIATIPVTQTPLGSGSMTASDAAIEAILVLSPRRISDEPNCPSHNIALLSTRPHGPRSPVPRSTVNTAGLGSAHTRLRVVSGAGRRVSAGRDKVPLKGDENESPLHNMPPIHLSGKRQHSEDQLAPRKRSPTRSPLEPGIPDMSQKLPDPLKVPSLPQRADGRRSSGTKTSRRSSGPLTTPRMISSGTATIVSTTTETTMGEVVMIDHGNVIAVMESMRQNVGSRTLQEN